MNTHDDLYLKALVRKLLNDLPYRRDWLDPALEEELERVSAETVTEHTVYGGQSNSFGLTSECIPGYQLAGGDRPETCTP